MSRKHNTKHPDRGLSRYSLRLAKRGLHKTPTMTPLADLRKRQRDITAAPPSEAGYAGWDLVDMSGV